MVRYTSPRDDLGFVNIESREITEKLLNLIYNENKDMLKTTYVVCQVSVENIDTIIIFKLIDKHGDISVSGFSKGHATFKIEYL